MRRVRCPHCNEYGFPAGRLPKEVIAVLACQHCEEISVLFRGKVIALNKRVLESGTLVERKEHLADVIAQFLESGMLDLSAAQEQESREEQTPPDRIRELPESAPHHHKPISDQEMERFLTIDLQCLDNPVYFKRIFG